MTYQTLFTNTFAFLNRHRLQIFLLFITILIPLVVFAILADEVLEKDHFWFDDRISYIFHDHSNPFRDHFMMIISKLGYLWGVVPTSLGILVYLSLNKKRYDALFFTTSVGGSAVLNRIAKVFFERERPDLWLTLAPEKNYSFPSGHAMGSMAFVAAIIVLLWPTRWRLHAISLGVIFVTLVGVSRIYLGVHYFSDIVAGVAASLAWVTGLSIIFYKQIGKPETAESLEASQVTLKEKL